MNYSLSEILLIIFFVITGIVTLLAFFGIALKTIFHWRKNPLKKNLTRMFAGICSLAAAWFFGGFLFFEIFILGGTSLNGKIEDGNFYLGGLGEKYTLVSENLFSTIQIFDRCLIALIIFCVLTGFVIDLTMKKGIKGKLFDDDLP